MRKRQEKRNEQPFPVVRRDVNGKIPVQDFLFRKILLKSF